MLVREVLGVSEFAAAAEAEWGWTERYGVGCNLLFVRDVPVESVIQALGMDLTQSRLLTPEQAEEQDDQLQWIRAGRSGNWTFVIDSNFRAVDLARAAVPELSRGGAVAWCLWTATIDGFEYFEDGVQVTQFEPMRSYERFGFDPDRFVPQMRQVGLLIDRPDGIQGDDLDVRVCTLVMLTLALGIQLSAEVAEGPLLTVKLGPYRG